MLGGINTSRGERNGSWDGLFSIYRGVVNR